MEKLEIDTSPIIGIDLGTTNTCVAVVIDNKVKIIHNDVGKNTTPSYVAFTERGRYVGEQAKQLSIVDPENVVYDSKRIIGRKFLDSAVQTDRKRWPFIVFNNYSNPMIQVGKGIHKKFTPEAISAMILEKMKKLAEDCLGVPVKRAIITVPARFNISQRKATIDAGKIAGLEVQKIITEPTAAAIAYSIQQNCTKKSHILVFDLGGGTFDVSVLKTENGQFKVLASDGDTHLGGEDFDNRLVDYLVAEFKNKHQKDPSANKKAMRRLKAKCEQAKETLSVSEEAIITIDVFFDNIDLQTCITRSRFDWINKNLFEECIDTVKNTLDKLEFTKNDIDHVILIGGSTRIIKIQDMLQEFFEGKKLNKSLNPDEAVAYGAALHAAQLKDVMSVESFQLQDVAPLSIGMSKQSGSMVFWIKRNTPLPTSVVKSCFTINDNQVTMKFKIYEGERLLSSDNTYLGMFRVKNLPKGLAGQVKVDVQFEVDDNGILHITAKEEVTQNEKKIKITSNIGRLSDAEVNRIVKEAEKYRQEDEKRNDIILAKNNLELFIFNMFSRMDNKELQIDLSNEEAEQMKDKCCETIEWIDQNVDASIEELTERLNELKIFCNKLIL